MGHVLAPTDVTVTLDGPDPVVARVGSSFFERIPAIHTNSPFPLASFSNRGQGQNHSYEYPFYLHVKENSLSCDKSYDQFI